jgi:DNA-binding protein HU-beta
MHFHAKSLSLQTVCNLKRSEPRRGLMPRDSCVLRAGPRHHPVFNWLKNAQKLRFCLGRAGRERGRARQQKLCRSRHTLFSAVNFPILSPDANQLTGDEMAAQMTKSQLIEKISAETEVAKKDVKGVLETLATVGYKELKKTGVFLVPGFAKFVVVKKPATKARQGTNPFTGEAMTFKAKPARKIVRARPVKAAKDAV